MDEDFEIEVTDLRTGQVLKTARDLPAPLVTPPQSPSPGLAAETPDRDFELEITDLPAAHAEVGERSTFAAPRAPGPSRRQMAGAAATGALVLVVLIGLLSGVVGKGGIGLGLFPTPVPTATLADGADTFYLVNGVPWGTMRADGRSVTIVYSQQNPTFFSLSRGRHTLEYDAPPFPTVKCVVTVPVAQSDSCPLYTPPNGDSNGGIASTNRGLDVGATLTHLSPQDYTARLAAASQSFAAPLAATTVPAGDRYQGAGGAVLVAKTSLQAQAFYVLSVDPSNSNGPACASLCDIQFGNGTPNIGAGWIISANLVSIWRYTDSSGATVQLPAIPQFLNDPNVQGGPIGVSTYLNVNWANGWQIMPQSSFYNLGLGQCFGYENMYGLTATFTNWTNGGYSSNEVGAPNPADGCLMEFQQSDSNGNSVGKPVVFLYRFGLIYAADAYSHSVDPSVPIASGLEATLARQLASKLQFATP